MAARGARQLTLVAKQAYYRESAMPAAVARRYYRQFAGARAILDVGCGNGDFGRLRPNPGVIVHGVDIDAGAIEQASLHERAVCVDLDTMPLPYADASFDAVLAKDIFEHLRDPGHLSREVCRVTRPGGVVIASVVMARPRRVWADYTHVRGFTSNAARLLLEDAGFQIEALWRMGGVPFSERLGFADAVPRLLSVPLFDALWGSSWELRARKGQDR